MNLPNDLLYSKSHEWVRKMPDGTVQVGLSDHAQSELGDIVFVNLPAVGDDVKAGTAMGDVESVKAVSDVFCPVSGKVLAVNGQLEDDASLINTDCYGAWLVQVGDVNIPEDLLSAAAYEAFVQADG